ncbi:MULTISPECIES: hypothetical protein [Streptomyces]|uniref:Uncharacterized protein n=1 Tax=Streptomyces eurythermus TaxID=42237 RepID=A0ABW6Z773_9ACTN|nr:MULTISPECIES: hypothetical protein [Streptomyces]QIS75031.1 hypothetical protein HB370_37885 [Streptomyces sp. DSM 40868]
MLLHGIADQLNTIADQFPLPDQVRADPAVGEILDDEIRNLARLLGYLAGESASRHRASARYPDQVTSSQRRTTLALARAAGPTSGALAALGRAVHDLGVLLDLTHQAPGRDRNRATAATHQRLADHFTAARTHLIRAAQQLRRAADTRTASPAAAPPSPQASPARAR